MSPILTIFPPGFRKEPEMKGGGRIQIKKRKSFLSDFPFTCPDGPFMYALPGTVSFLLNNYFTQFLKKGNSIYIERMISFQP